MSIRLKIALGFIILTVVIVSSVSFWAAQSLGFSIDSSDLQKLESLKTQITTILHEEQQILNRMAKDIAKSFIDLNMLQKSAVETRKFADSLKSNLNLDWLEVYKHEKAKINETSIISKPASTNGVPVRLAKSGPYSYHGYLISTVPITSDCYVSIARKPDLSKVTVPMYCIFDSRGIFENHNFNESFSLLKQLREKSFTGQVKNNDELFRVRVFKLNDDCNLLTGYPAQRAMISKPDIDQLMIRLAVLQVLGLLILGFFLGRKFLAPLKALGQGIEKVAMGDWKEIPLDLPPMKGSGDEIETVAESFNKMVRELTSAQNRLIEVQKELAKKDKLAALGRFSAGIAHEINNPLSTILVNAGLIKDSIDQGRKVSAEEIEEIVSEVKRCKNIISTLKTYTTQTRPSLVRQNFRAALKYLVNYVKDQHEFRKLEIIEEIDGDGDVLLDVSAIRQVFQNIVKNAQEAMSDTGSNTIYIISQKHKNHFQIDFKDTGEGFKCDPELIFEPLFTTKAQGTGLGLIICQAIIEGHGGRIKALRENEFTVIRIELPVAEGAIKNNIEAEKK
ncbi:MAG: hypothetical protein Kow0029_23500 [Candidatus Rifleibacteriota bacterium]